MKLSAYLLVLFALAFLPATAKASITLSEGFEDISTLAGKGWLFFNNSTPAAGSETWFQGGLTGVNAQSGPPNSYIAANSNSVESGPNVGGTISNWMITPLLSVGDGDVFSFFTQTSPESIFADRLQVRFSRTDLSQNFGDAALLDIFDEVLFDINNEYFEAGYPLAWGDGFSSTLAGIGARTEGRFAFRYFVEEAGNRSNAIAIDTVQLTAIPEPSSGVILLVGSFLILRRKRA